LEGSQVPSENYSIEYAYVSQRGYYPEAPNKTNQDTYGVQTEFMGNPNSHLFGVFDGHGTQGTACSSFARDKVRACPLSHSLPSGRNIVLEVACVPASRFQNAVPVASRTRKPTRGASGRR
jgi:serine/threonine protein phosphatase PrpC